MPSPTHVIADGQDVYLTAGGVTSGTGQVVRIPGDGGAPVVIARPASPWGLAVDDTWVYWADPGCGDANIWSAPKAGFDGGAATPTLLIHVQARGPLGALALDQSYVYWLQVDELVEASLHRIPKTGGTTEEVGAMWNGYEFLTYDDGGIYGATSEGPDGSPGGILQYDTTSGRTTFLGAGQVSPIGVAVGGQRVYWTDMLAGVFAAPLDGGAAVNLAADVPNAFPLGIAELNGVVYWAAFAENAVRSVASR